MTSAGSCPQAHTCSDHEKEVCPGPAPAPRRPATHRTRLGLETLEAREVFSVNPIVAENLLPGNPQSEWDIVGAGDPTIQGFATDISVDQGQTVSFKINDTSLAPYHIDIYRIGYYGGAGARKVATIPSSQTLRTIQPAPLTNAATGLVDAGNWIVTASWAVPVDRRLRRLHRRSWSARTRAGPATSSSSSATTTGSPTCCSRRRTRPGRRTTTGAGRAPTTRAARTGSVPTRSATTARSPCAARRAGWARRTRPSGPKYPMIRWMEANGYNVSYSTDVDTDRRGSELLEHKVFLSVGHDEYWSAGQRANVEAARRRRREPGVLQRQRDVLEDPVGEQHRRVRAPRTGRW